MVKEFENLEIFELYYLTLFDIPQDFLSSFKNLKVLELFNPIIEEDSSDLSLLAEILSSKDSNIETFSVTNMTAKNIVSKFCNFIGNT